MRNFAKQALERRAKRPVNDNGPGYALILWDFGSIGMTVGKLSAAAAGTRSFREVRGQGGCGAIAPGCSRLPFRTFIERQ